MRMKKIIYIMVLVVLFASLTVDRALGENAKETIFPTMGEGKLSTREEEPSWEGNIRGADKPLLTFEVISDTHITGSDNNHTTNNKLINTLEYLEEKLPNKSLIINCGDFTDNGSENQMKGYFNILGNFDENFKFMTCLGNHDVGLGQIDWAESRDRYLSLNSKYMTNNVGKAYYDEWIDGYHFIMLNTEYSLHLQSYISTEQLKWLDETMAENAEPTRPIFVGLHQPLRDTFQNSNEWPVGVQDHKIKEVLRKYPQTILFTGHLHDGLGLEETKVIETDAGTLVNVPSLSYNLQDNPQGEIGFNVSVYKDEVKIELRDYLNDRWISEHSYTISLDPGTRPIGKVLDVNFDNDTALDKSGYGNNGEIFGNPKFVKGVNGGRALQISNPHSLTKASQYIKFENVINPNKDNFTIIFTYKGSLSGEKRESIITNGPSDNRLINPEFIIGNFKDTRGLALGLNLPLGWPYITGHTEQTEDRRWHSIVAVVEKGKNMILYIDGEEANRILTTENFLGNEEDIFNLIIGADSSFENGARDIYLDEIKVYRRALGAGEIETVWGPFKFDRGTNNIKISWLNKAFFSRDVEPAYVLLNNKRVLDIESGDTATFISYIESNKFYDIKLVTSRKSNRSILSDVYSFRIKTRYSQVNKDDLLSLYNLHKNKSVNDYTNESWEEFLYALNQASEVLEDMEATLEEINVAIDGLTISVGKLKKKGIWKNEEEGWKYQNPDGTFSTDKWQIIGGKWYYFNKRSYMVTGWLKYKNKWYYLNTKGAMKTNWVKVKNKWYYLNQKGAMKIGWLELDGKWYYLDSSGAMERGWIKVGSKWYYMNSSGEMEKGWIKLGGKWYFLNNNGSMEERWSNLAPPSKEYNKDNPAGIGIRQKIKTNNILVDTSLEMTLKEVIRGERAWSMVYEFDSSNIKPDQDEEYILAKIKVKLVDIKNINSIQLSPLYFTAFNSKNEKYDYIKINNMEPPIGETLNKGKSIEGCIGFLIKKADDNPKFTYNPNFTSKEGIWFHFKEQKDEWTKGGKDWYYFSPNGSMSVGWTKVSSKWYYMKTSGVMATGWIKVSGKWYYMDKSGAMLSDTTVDGYILGKDGAML